MKSNLVKILATLGLIVAIALILRGVFDVGKIGFKNFSSKLPILKCEINNPDGSKKMMFYDLEKIENDDPTNDMTQDQFQKWRNQKNLEATTFTDDEKYNEYVIRYKIHEDGMDKSYFVKIKKDTGVVEYWFPPSISLDASSQEFFQSYIDAKIFKGVCDKVERKNL